MKIEITDREMWLEKLGTIWPYCEAERKRRDAEYEAWWHTTTIGWFRKKLNTGTPPVNTESWNPETYYPSKYGCFVEDTLFSLIALLDSKGTGLITIDEKEFNLLNKYYKQANPHA